MDDTIKSISEAGFIEFVDLGSVTRVDVLLQEDNTWAVVMIVGTKARVLRSARERIRSWRHLETVARFVQKAGINKFRVNLSSSDWQADFMGANR